MTQARPIFDPPGRPIRPRGANSILVGGFILLCGLGPATLSLSPRHDEPVAVLRLSPDELTPAAIAGVDVRILWMSPRGHILILSSAPPNLVWALYRESATLVVAATAVSGCLPKASASSSTIGTHQL